MVFTEEAFDLSTSTTSSYLVVFRSHSMLNVCRYFTNHELYELFQLDNPLESKTQQQLEQMHAHQRVTDTDLDNHLAYLNSCRKLLIQI